MSGLFAVEISPSLDVLFEGLVTKIGDLPGALQKEGTDYLSSALPNFMDDLTAHPGAVVTPIDWTSEAQYAAHLATNNWGWGIPYHRDDKGISTAWDSGVKIDSDAITVRIANNNPDAVYVYGSFSDESGKPQQGFHAKTGWRLARPLVLTFFNVSATEIMTRAVSVWWRTK